MYAQTIAAVILAFTGTFCFYWAGRIRNKTSDAHIGFFGVGIILLMFAGILAFGNPNGKAISFGSPDPVEVVVVQKTLFSVTFVTLGPEGEERLFTEPVGRFYGDACWIKIGSREILRVHKGLNGFERIYFSPAYEQRANDRCAKKFSDH